MHGQGKQTFPDGANYEGQFENDKRHGYGIGTYANGTKYEEMYENNERQTTMTSMSKKILRAIDQLKLQVLRAKDQLKLQEKIYMAYMIVGVVVVCLCRLFSLFSGLFSERSSPM